MLNLKPMNCHPEFGRDIQIIKTEYIDKSLQKSNYMVWYDYESVK